MPHPDRLPDLFLDRSLGRIRAPALLRAAGLRLVTLSEHYGVPADETVRDETWLELAGEKGWKVLMKDARIRYRPAEREAVRLHGVRCFCLASQQLTGDVMANRFLVNLIYAVHATPDRAAFSGRPLTWCRRCTAPRGSCAGSLFSCQAARSDTPDQGGGRSSSMVPSGRRHRTLPSSMRS